MSLLIKNFTQTTKLEKWLNRIITTATALAVIAQQIAHYLSQGGGN
jgi:hypothetical protein